MTKPTAIITGAGSGIGKASALLLAADGFSVVLAGRRAEPLDAAVAEIVSGGGEALAVPTDVRDEGSVARLFERARGVHGRVDLLFNNAGAFASASSIEDLSLSDWTDAVATNVTGTFLCTREAIRVMKAQDPIGGRIINNGSIAAHVPRPDSVDYTTTKHAITGLTKSTSLDGRKYRIACGQIDVGNAAMEQGQIGPVPQADGSLRLEPTMRIADVARAVSYMASLPLEANAQFLTVMATNMPYLGRG